MFAKLMEYIGNSLSASNSFFSQASEAIILHTDAGIIVSRAVRIARAA